MSHIAAFGSKIFLFFLLGAILTQCKSKSTQAVEVDPAFTGYVSAFTSGIISNQSAIRVRLAEAHPEAKPGEITGNELFDFTPDIKGKSWWIDEQTIAYRPTASLSPGKLYEAEFFLSELIEVPSDLKTLVFQFQVMNQSMDLEFKGMEPVSDNNLKWQRIHASALTFDYAEGGAVEKSVRALQNGKALTLRWEHDPNGKIHRMTIDSIRRTEDRGQVILQWNGKALGFDGKKEQVFEIPPLGEFKVLDVGVTQQPEQSITVFFSDPVAGDNLEGLVYLQPAASIRLAAEGNAVKIYPASRLQGPVTLSVNDGIRNVMGYQLMAPFQKEVAFTSMKPAVELIGSGVIMPTSNGLVFPFKAVSLKAVNVKIVKIFEDNVTQFLQVNQYDGTNEMKRVGRIVYKGEVDLKSEKTIDYGSWNAFSLDLSKLIKAEPGAIYRVHLSFTPAQSLYPCEDDGEVFAEPESAFGDDFEMADFDNPDNSWYYHEDRYIHYGAYNHRERDNPCKPSYYMAGGRWVARNVLASDLGIIAKSGHSSTMIVAVTDLTTVEPVQHVAIEIYNFQNQLIDIKQTDKDGFVKIDLQKKPFLLVAKKDSQRGYLRLDDGSALSLSMFDIGGQQVERGVKGYLYGERGVWRPGDSLYVSFMLEDKNKTLPSNHPVVFELYTPQHQLYQRTVRTASLNGFYDFRTTTSQDAPTGNWLARVKVGGSEFTRTLKIESIKPNRLKIDLDFNAKILSSVEPPKGELEVKWLHGAVAGNLKADIEMTLSKSSSVFKGYEGYAFDDPSREFEAREEIVFEGRVDADGKAAVYPDIQVQKNAPGMLQAHFRIRAFENGGEFSVDRFSIPYSPYRGYVGVKVPEGKGWNGALYSDEPNLIPIVTVDENGRPVDRKGVKIEIYNVYWRWWWERSDEDRLANYIANRSANLIETATIDTKDGKNMYELNLGENHYGRKFIRVTDPVTGHSAGQTFYMTYKGWWNNAGAENPGGAEMLTFSTDQKSYQVGDKIRVTIPSAKQGRTLASIESGSRVLKAFWIDMKEGENQFEIEATKEMAPTAYIHLTLIQPHNNVKNDLPIRLFGVQPVSIQNPGSHLQPVIAMPDELAPEENFSVKITEADGNPMTYTLAVVDDGLLDLTRFKTPDPWSHFYAKEALSVRTWDMYKYVIGAFTGEMAGLLALGGDEYIVKDGGAKANRFKPVVKFLGPFELKANRSNTHTLEMPNYVGSVRTMVIAGQNGGYGSAEKTTPVKKPLMVLATMPRVVGPDEKVQLPVAVFAMDKNIKDVSVSVQTNELLEINDDKTKTIHFNREGDQVVRFNLGVADRLGIAKVKVIAKSGGETAHYDVELDVRAPNPAVTDVVDAVIEPGRMWSSDYKPIGMTGTNQGVVEVSTLPAMKIEERLQYLINYPHGCVEQIASTVFPQLFLANLVDLDEDEKIKIDENIKAGINRLRSFQIYSGGLSYWPGQEDIASDWGTSYAGHFMLEAQAKGYSLPPGFLANWIKFQNQRANTWTPDREHNSYHNGQLIQAYRLYTLAMAREPAMGAMNRMRNLKNLSLAARWRLAAAYFLAGKKDVAENLINNLSTEIAPYRELSYSFGSAERDKAMILETLILLERKTDARAILEELADAMASNRWYSTQTTAYTLLAASKFAALTGGAGQNAAYAYELNGRKNTVSAEAPVSQIELSFNGTAGGKVSVTNTSANTLFVKMQLQGIPVTGDQTNAENSLRMSVAYLDMNENEIDPAALEQGTDFIAEVRLTHPGLRDDYQEMALTQIFPSGWEIRNTRMDDASTTRIADSPTYQDIRDDRVLTYFDLDRGKTKTFRILLNAAYPGEYYLPTVYCQAMYDNEINARKAGKWVTVQEQGKGGNP